MTVQYLLVTIAVIASLGYAGYRLYRSLKPKKGCDIACAGCPLKDSCEEKRKIKEDKRR
ncbi:MAG: FeoB-associated Cys-rich membrane protein [Prevotella sp.]|nr:FeoB-associated Cys-rich membrane protein [Prevotella sp.]